MVPNHGVSPTHPSTPSSTLDTNANLLITPQLNSLRVSSYLTKIPPAFVLKRQHELNFLLIQNSTYYLKF